MNDDPRIFAPTPHDLEQLALAFATKAHAGQTRKYTGEPYIHHPIAVAEIVRSVTHYPDMIAATLLHDTVEDVDWVSSSTIHTTFGHGVGNLVDWLTDVSTPADGNRAVRKEIDRLHLAKAPPCAQTIKLADLIDNTSSIKRHDSDFWRVYRLEKLALLEVLTLGDRTLWMRARALCED